MEKSEIMDAEYICNFCKNITILKQKDPIRCSSCGKNILYKARDKNSPVQLQAI